MTDRFSTYSSGLESPATQIFTITPSDTVPIDPTPRWIRIGGEGTITVQAINSDTSCPISNVKVGEVIYGRLLYVLDTGTDAEVTITGYA